jgi:hypothetical protein
MLPETITVWILPENSAFPRAALRDLPRQRREPGTLAEVIERLAA